MFSAPPSAATRGPRLASIFPSGDAALIQARLRVGLSTTENAQAIAAIRAAVAMPAFALTVANPYTVTGEPVVFDELASRVTGLLTVLILAALVAMALALALVFGGPLTLLPLGIAVGTAAITFGLLAALHAGLTIASLAALPILIGLAVDYAIQYQSRVREARDADVSAAATRAARDGAPTIALAALATAVSFAVLRLSPVPMVRGFGLVIVIGIAIALLLTLFVSPAAIALGRTDFGILGASVRGAGEILTRRRTDEQDPSVPRLGARSGRRRRTIVPAALAGGAVRLTRRPGRTLAVAAVLAVIGWVADTQMTVQTDVTALVGSRTPALRDLARLQRLTGDSGEIDVFVRGGDVATPAVIGWMAGYERRMLARFAGSGHTGCVAATLCPAVSAPDLFTSGSGRPVPVTAHAIDTTLAEVPRYFTTAVISADRRDAVLAFGIRLMPLAQQERVVDVMRAALTPPPGIDAQLAGLPVLAVDANAALSSPAQRLLMTLAALLAASFALLVAVRDVRRAIVPMIPIALASGWSALVLFALGIPLNPMSATLGALVIAVSTEFSVLLSERYRQERSAGSDPAEALSAAYRRTGAAVIASGTTVIAGFAVLILASIPMLRNFGLVTVIDLTVSLSGVLLVLPSVIALAESLSSGRRELDLGASDASSSQRTPAQVA